MQEPGLKFWRSSDTFFVNWSKTKGNGTWSILLTREIGYFRHDVSGKVVTNEVQIGVKTKNFSFQYFFIPSLSVSGEVKRESQHLLSYWFYFCRICHFWKFWGVLFLTHYYITTFISLIRVNPRIWLITLQVNEGIEMVFLFHWYDVKTEV